MLELNMAQGSQLTQEQLARVKQEIASLPPEQQQAKLREFLSSLSPEQIKQLQEQQGQQCPFCLMASGQIATKKIYEDAKILAVLDINPANPGHALVIPRKHYALLALMPPDEVEHLFKVVNSISNALLQIAQGTNIFVANGPVAGQKAEHAIVHVIPRYEGDGLSFTWSPKKQTEKQLTEMQAKIKELIKLPEEKAKPEAKPKKISKKEEKELEKKMVKPEERLP